MRDKLQQYVQLLFAGAENCEDIQQEILLNTLDRYDDLIAEGKVPEAAYRLAIAGIGDINEILGSHVQQIPHTTTSEPASAPQKADRRKKKAIAVGLYIMSPIPLFIANETGRSPLGLCAMLCMVAIATGLLILTGSNHEGNPDKKETLPILMQHRTLWLSCVLFYLILSISTGAWFITWLLFPIGGVLIQLSAALKEYKEAADNET